MKKTFSFIRGIAVILIAVVVTTLAINASDNLGALKSSLLAGVFGAGGSSCGEGMTTIPLEGGNICIDMFEASPNKECPFSDPKNDLETKQNADTSSCMPQSAKGVVPWRNVNRNQAELLCAKAGKRLPTNKEWYRASLGTPDIATTYKAEDCNLGKVNTSDPRATGEGEKCVSSSHVYDMVGNLWEWVTGDVSLGQYQGRLLPSTGYVSEIDSDGVAVKTASAPDDLFNRDYFWSDSSEVRGMIRGGYFGTDSDAGVYSINSSIPSTFSSIGTGFRCVK